MNSAGQLTGARVTWTPEVDSDYRLEVAVGGGSGSVLVAGSGTSSRTDGVSISPPVGVKDAGAATLCIS